MSYRTHSDSDREAMLARIGLASVDALFDDLPASLTNPHLDLPRGLAEPELAAHLRHLAERNTAHQLVCFAGGGSYDHYIPAAVDALAGRSEFVTGYTPYQPEMTQGLLQAIYEYQTIICELTGLDVSNASLYDGASGLWEAMLICIRETRRGRVVVSAGISPRWLAVLASHARQSGFEVVVVPDAAGGQLDLEALRAALATPSAALVMALPSVLGVVQESSEAIAAAHEAGAKVVVAANPLALALYRTPGELGADLCVGDGQPLGIPQGFGGPSFGFIAARAELVRKLPGRMVGATVDTEGQRGYVLTLQAREQHIRRDKASSNICSNQALMALRATVYCTLLGRQGLVEVAENCARAAAWLRRELSAAPGVEVVGQGPWFHEFVVRLAPGQARVRHAAALRAGVLAGLPLGDWWPEREDELLLCVTEKRTRAELEQLVDLLTGE